MKTLLWVLQAPIMQLLRVIFEERGLPTRRMVLWASFYALSGGLRLASFLTPCSGFSITSWE